MIKAHQRGKSPMRRVARVFLNELNKGKSQTLTEFLHLCHDVTQYFIDYFWNKEDFSPVMPSLEVIHRGRNRFGITTRLAQCLAKQAKEVVRSTHAVGGRKPQFKSHIVTLYYHFVTIEPFNGHFDFAVKLTGSGAPRMVIPVKSTKVMQKFLNNDWRMSKTIRLGRNRDKMFVDFIFEKPHPPKRVSGIVIGMDSNYKSGFVFSNGYRLGEEIHDRIQTFFKRQKHTYDEIKSLVGYHLKKADLSNVKILCVEDLRNVKRNKRGKFSRQFNRRLSHWLYAYAVNWLKRRCEELGIRLERKSPWKTSQFCSNCCRWDRRSRVRDKFCCVHCGFSVDADLNAARNLAFLGEAGVYGLRSYKAHCLAH